MKRGIVGPLVVALLAAACTSQGGAGAYRPVQHEKLTLADRTYGLAPQKDSSITYQPDVVIVGGGASSIVSQSNSGVSVTLKTGAPRLSEVQPGKVVFVTGRIVGRVVGTKRTDAGVEVFMTPVQLTDVVRDAKIKVTVPVDLASSSVIQGQNFDSVPGSTTPNGSTDQLKAIPDGGVEESTAKSTGQPVDQPGPYESTTLSPDTPGTVTPTRYVLPTASHLGRSAPAAPPIPPIPPIPSLDSVPGAKAVSEAIPQANAFPGSTAVTGGYTMSPMISGGVGVRLAYDKAGTQIAASLLLKLGVPTVSAALYISGGRITYAALKLRGAAGIHMKFEAGSQLGLQANTNSQVAVPLDFAIPLGGPLPLVLDWRQQFILKTGFSARNSTMSVTADYTFDGSLGFTYRPGNFSVIPLGKVISTTNAVDNMNGISVGINSLVLAYQAKLILGIGAFGFASGLELGLNTSWGILKSTDISPIPLTCRQVTFTMLGTVGIGWAIPKAVAAVVNFILGFFHTSIPSSGGVRSAPVNIAQRNDYAPDQAYCRLKPPS